MIRMTIIIAILVGAAAFGGAKEHIKTIIYEKYLPDGRIVIVEKEERAERKEVRSNRDGNIVKLHVDVNVENVTMKIRDKKGAEVIVWRKENIYPRLNFALPFTQNIIISDVVASDDYLSLIYTIDTTDVDTIRKNSSGNYDIVYHQTLFRQSSGNRKMVLAKLVWIDELYALISFEPKSSEIWRIAKDKHEQVYIARIGQQ